MTDPILKIKIVARAEKALLLIQAKRVAKRMVLVAGALVFALLGLGMLNFAGYQALATTQGPAVAALLIALFDGALALVIVAVARSAGASNEQEKMVEEIRDMAYNELNVDIEEFKSELGQVSAEIGSIRAGLSAWSSGANSLFGGIAPLFNVLIDFIKRRSAKDKK